MKRNDELSAVDERSPSATQEESNQSEENAEDTVVFLNADTKKEAKKAKKQAKEKKKKERYEDRELYSNRPKPKLFTLVAAIFVWSIIGIAFIGLSVGLLIGYKLLEGTPTLVLSDLVAPESSVIYDNDGNVIAELGEYKRENIDYEDIPNILIDAFIAIEDSRYFEHNGFDIPRFVKAALENIQSGSFSQGGSTFDMQLIKNTYFQVDAGEDSTLAERSIARKAQEIILAMQADNELDKREIFASYLNLINFGNNIRGIQKAAQYYFGKDVSELDLSESAFLAGIINSPNACNPYNELIKYDESNTYVSADIDYLANGTARRNEVLDMMVYHGYITEEEAELAKAIKLEDQLVGELSIWSDTVPYYQSYIDAVIEEVIEKTGLDPTTTPMQIYTNMDAYMQQLVYDIQNTDDIVTWYRDDLQNAIISIDNQTGAIVAIGGGRNQSGSLTWNRATMSRIQPGSTIKPVFEYLLAFEKLGWATSHTVTDGPVYIPGTDHLIANASGTYDGDMLITEAVARSLNTPAVKTLQALIDELGADYCMDFLESIGIEVDRDTFDIQYAIGGNTLQVSPAQLASAHAILFNGGYYIEAHTINYIVFSDGSTYVADTEGTQVVSEGAAYMAATLEYEVVYGSWYNYTQILADTYPVYAKTGTTDWGDSGTAYGIPVGAAKDSWLVCSTSNYTNVIWLGFDQAAEGAYLTSYDDSINLKGQIGNILLDAAIEHFGYEPVAIEQPDSVVEITHVMGLYPYIEPTTGTSVTGLILKEYYELLSEDEIEYEYRESTISGIDITFGDGTIQVDFLFLGEDTEEGVQAMTAVSASGETTTVYGRLYYPRIRYIVDEETVYYVYLYIDDVLIFSGVSEDTSILLSYDSSELIGASTMEICGSASSLEDQYCAVVDLTESSEDDEDELDDSS